MTTLTETDKLGLSPAEIAAIESEDGDNLDDLKPGEPEAEETAKPQDEESFEDQRTAPPVFVPPPVDQGELARLKNNYDDAKARFDDGDIDYAELDEAKDAYNQAKWKAEFAQESNQAAVNEHWKWEQKRFLDENPNFLANETLNSAFVTHVNRLIGTSEGQAMTDRQVLQAAKQKVEKDLGIGRRGREDYSTQDIDEPEAATGGPGEFAYLDRLEGAAFQNAIDRLTPAQLQRYEDSQR